MTAQAWQQTSFSESQEPQQNGDNFSTHIASLITNALLSQVMPKAQILSYLVPPISDSGSVKDANLYNMLMERTVSADPLLKDSMIRRHEANVISHEKFKAKPHQNIFISLQKWQGIVIDVMDDAFLARLIDLTQKGTDEEAEFSFDEISEEDKPLIRSGAIFYWNIGYHTSYSGQRTRTSLLRFRRLPAWTQREIDAAKREAERIGKALGWQ
jgi:hypothetical protein